MTIFFKRSALVASFALSLAGAAHGADKKFDIVMDGGSSAPIIRASTNTVVNYTGTTPANIVGSLVAADSTFNRPDADCFGPSKTGTAVAYDTITFTNTTASNATISLAMGAVGSPASCATGPDTYLFMYNNAFNPATPLMNCAVGNDDFNGPCAMLSGVSIPAGAVRVFVLTSFGDADFFDYEVTFGGTTPVSLQNFSVD